MPSGKKNKPKIKAKDDELEQLRAEIERLKAQVAQQKQPSETDDQTPPRDGVAGEYQSQAADAESVETSQASGVDSGGNVDSGEKQAEDGQTPKVVGVAHPLASIQSQKFRQPTPTSSNVNGRLPNVVPHVKGMASSGPVLPNVKGSGSLPRGDSIADIFGGGRSEQKGASEVDEDSTLGDDLSEDSEDFKIDFNKLSYFDLYQIAMSYVSDDGCLSGMLPELDDALDENSPDSVSILQSIVTLGQAVEMGKLKNNGVPISVSDVTKELEEQRQRNATLEKQLKERQAAQLSPEVEATLAALSRRVGELESESLHGSGGHA